MYYIDPLKNIFLDYSLPNLLPRPIRAEKGDDAGGSSGGMGRPMTVEP